MHRLDDKLKSLDAQLKTTEDAGEITSIKAAISDREKSLLPVYEQIAVQFCELHDTPGRMKAVGVIEKDVEWIHLDIAGTSKNETEATGYGAKVLINYLRSMC